MKYEKLVRDKVPYIIGMEGRTAVTHKASDAEYWQKLKEKLMEELDEFFQSEKMEEIVDMTEVIEAIMEYKKFNHQEYLSLKKKKALERGKFKDRIILDEVH
jgi:predicted house-cleaning noncanonical NTP pyrophosphatase (MazG superfamily)